MKIRQFNFKLTFTGLICKGYCRFWHSLLWALWTYGLKRSVLPTWGICFLKSINYIQMYLFGINGLNHHHRFGCIVKIYWLDCKANDAYYQQLVSKMTLLAILLHKKLAIYKALLHNNISLHQTIVNLQQNTCCIEIRTSWILPICRLL